MDPVVLTVQKASFDPSDNAAALRAARYSLGIDGAPQAVNPDADEHGGIWLGSPEALAALGLERGAEVDEQELAYALQGRHAVTGAQVRRPGTRKVTDADGEPKLDANGKPIKEQRVNSFRLAFSVPKDVSVVWSQAGPELRAQIERAVLESAHGAIDHFVRTRNVISGKEVGKGFAAAFSLHTLARTAQGEELPSPQLHAHVDLVGVVGADGALRTPNSQAFYKDSAMRVAGALGRARLARALDGLGFEIVTQTGNGGRYFEIAGVPRGLCERMSGRSRDVAAHIQALKDATGQTPSARQAAAAAVATRTAKGHVDLEQAEELWRAHGREFDFDVAKIRRAGGASGRRRALSAPQGELRTRLLQRVREDGPTVTLGRIEAMAYELKPIDLSETEAADVIRVMQDDGDLIALDQWQVTTREIREDELYVQRVARTAARAGGPALSRAAIAAGIAVAEEGLGGHRLDPEQKAAVEALTAGSGWSILTGRAGTGKGPVLEAIAEARRQEGWSVVGTAIDGATTQRVGQQLKAEGVTIRQLLTRYEKGKLAIDGRTLIVIDEASKVGLSDWVALARIVDETRAHVLGVGDVGQIGAIELAGMFDVMCAKDGGLPVAEMRKVRRHRDPENPSREHPWLVDYQTAMYENNAHEAIRILEREKALTMHETRDDAMVGLVARWEQRRRDHGFAVEDAVMIVYGSNDDVDVVNELAQDRRLKAGEIGGQSVRAVDRRYGLHAGDVVMMRGAAFEPEGRVAGKRDRRVENGTMGVVIGVDPERDRVRVRFQDPEHGHRDVTLDQRQMRELHARAKPGESAPALRLAYAGHPFPMQGATFKYVGSLWGGDGQDKESTYSGDTRVKYWLDVHFDRESGGRDGTDADRLQRMGDRLSVSKHKLASITWERRPDVEIARFSQSAQEIPAPRSWEGREAAREQRLRQAARRNARERTDPLEPYVDALGPARVAWLREAAEQLAPGLVRAVDERGEEWLAQMLAHHEPVAQRFDARAGEVRDAGFVQREADWARERAEESAEAAMGYEEQAAELRGFGNRAERADAEQAAAAQHGFVAKESRRAADLEHEANERLALSGERLDRWLGEHAEAAARWVALSNETAARDELRLLRDLRDALEKPSEPLVERLGPAPSTRHSLRGEWQELAVYTERRRLEAERAEGAPRGRYPKLRAADPAAEQRVDRLRAVRELGPREPEVVRDVAPEVDLDVSGPGLDL